MANCEASVLRVKEACADVLSVAVYGRLGEQPCCAKSVAGVLDEGR